MPLQGSSDLIAYLAAHRYLHRNEEGVRSRLSAWRKEVLRDLDRDYVLQPVDAVILDHVLMDVIVESFALGWAACQRQSQARSRKGRRGKADAAPGSSVDLLA